MNPNVVATDPKLRSTIESLGKLLAPYEQESFLSAVQQGVISVNVNSSDRYMREFGEFQMATGIMVGAYNAIVARRVC